MIINKFKKYYLIKKNTMENYDYNQITFLQINQILSLNNP